MLVRWENFIEKTLGMLVTWRYIKQKFYAY